MELQDFGMCVEFSFEKAKNGESHVIYRPGNIKSLEKYMRTAFIETLKEEYKAERCWISNIYVKAKTTEGTQFEYRLGNNGDYDMEAQLF